MEDYLIQTANVIAETMDTICSGIAIGTEYNSNQRNHLGALSLIWSDCVAQLKSYGWTAEQISDTVKCPEY